MGVFGERPGRYARESGRIMVTLSFVVCDPGAAVVSGIEGHQELLSQMFRRSLQARNGRCPRDRH
jgi:hypothetical protein